MKKLASPIVILSTLSQSASAQPELGTTETISIAMYVLNALAILLAICIASSFVLTLVRLFLNDRLKKALIEKGASQQVIAQLLPSEKKERTLALKWCCLFSAAGLGLLAAYFFQPMGWHSVIILTFSLAVGFLAYYLLIRRTSS